MNIGSDIPAETLVRTRFRAEAKQTPLDLGWVERLFERCNKFLHLLGCKDIAKVLDTGVSIWYRDGRLFRSVLTHGLGHLHFSLSFRLLKLA